jgi:hypothetical protein
MKYYGVFSREDIDSPLTLDKLNEIITEKKNQRGYLDKYNHDDPPKIRYDNELVDFSHHYTVNGLRAKELVVKLMKTDTANILAVIECLAEAFRLKSRSSLSRNWGLYPELFLKVSELLDESSRLLWEEYHRIEMKPIIEKEDVFICKDKCDSQLTLEQCILHKNIKLGSYEKYMEYNDKVYRVGIYNDYAMARDTGFTLDDLPVFAFEFMVDKILDKPDLSNYQCPATACVHFNSKFIEYGCCQYKLFIDYAEGISEKVRELAFECYWKTDSGMRQEYYNRILNGETTDFAYRKLNETGGYSLGD